MTGPSRELKWLVLGACVGVVAGLLATAWLLRTLRPQRSLPRELPVLGHVSAFNLTNQQGQPFAFSQLTGTVWVADIIFTRCPGPCVRMSQQMKALQTALSLGSPVRLVSLTADPAHDTPAVLQDYGVRFQADPARWIFLTGAKADVYRLAIKDLLLAVEENAETNSLENLFIHSTKFVLVDRQGALRGVFDGEDPDSKPRILAAIRALLTSR